MGARILAAATPSNPLNDNNYDALCSCTDVEKEQCHCRQNQAWTTFKWRPQNWHHWPLLKKTLIYIAVGVLLIWLFIYLILHFYLQRQD